jgi:hypothetical protein
LLWAVELLIWALLLRAVELLIWALLLRGTARTVRAGASLAIRLVARRRIRICRHDCDRKSGHANAGGNSRCACHTFQMHDFPPFSIVDVDAK